MKSSIEKRGMVFNLNTVKGTMMLLVILDHNDLAKKLFPHIFSPMTYHVLGFLFLAFLARPRKFDGQFVMDRFARYFVPFLFFYTLSSILYATIYLKDENFQHIALNYFLGAFIGSATTLKIASGFMMFWFLPAFFTLSIFIGYFNSCRNTLRNILIMFFTITHFFIAFVPYDVVEYIPLGIPIVLYIFILGLLNAKIINYVNEYNINSFKILFSLLFIGAYAVSFHYNTHIEIGSMKVDSIEHVYYLILHNILGISGFLVVYLFSQQLSKIPFIQSIGAYSLIIYLAHPLVYKMLVSINKSFLDFSVKGDIEFIANLVITVIITTAISLIVAMTISRTQWLHDLITPKGLSDWLPIKILAFRLKQ